MARMTENMNLQQALYKRIEQVGKGVVDIKESSRVAEMREGDGGRWVGLRIGENHWVRGSLVVSHPISSANICCVDADSIDRCGRTELTSETLLPNRNLWSRLPDARRRCDTPSSPFSLVPKQYRFPAIPTYWSLGIPPSERGSFNDGLVHSSPPRRGT